MQEHNRTAGRLGQQAGTTSKQHQGQRFPDKFHAMLQAAQDAHIRAAHQREMADRRSLSVAMLVEGRAAAFVDFFMLSQPPPAAQQEGNNSRTAADLPWQSMVLLQEQLVRADAATREGNLQVAFDAHRTMAKHFTQQGMLENAVFFWKKCLQVRAAGSSRQPCPVLSRMLNAGRGNWKSADQSAPHHRQLHGQRPCLSCHRSTPCPAHMNAPSMQVAVDASSGPQQLEANCALGLLYESQGQPTLAMACHGRCLQLAQELQRPDDAATAYAQLVQVCSTCCCCCSQRTGCGRHLCSTQLPALCQPPPQSAHHFPPVAAATVMQVYAQDAEQLARQGDKDAAAASYTKCRDAALGCGDLTAAAAAAHHLGLIAQQGGDWQQALKHQR